MSQITTDASDCRYQPLPDHAHQSGPIPHTLVTRVQQYGANTLTDAELLALLLNDTLEHKDGLHLAQQLLQEQHGLIGLSRAPMEEWSTSACSAARIKAALELGRRLSTAAPGERPVINSASKLADRLLLDRRPLEQAVFKCALLTTPLHLLKIVTVHQGTLNSNLARAGDIFREPVRLGAAAVLLAHNHPSGDTMPSTEDIATTRHLVAVGKLLDIAVLDHLIIGDRWISMRAHGWGWSTPTADVDEAIPTLLNERKPADEVYDGP